MPSKATIIIVGHLGRDPELKFTSAGKAVCSMSVPTDSGFGDKKKTTWWRVSAWDKTAEACGKNLRKGSLVQIVGEPYEREWSDKDGVVKKSLEIQAREVTFLGSKNDGAGQAAAPARGAWKPDEPEPAKAAAKPWGAEDDDVPFSGGRPNP